MSEAVASWAGCISTLMVACLECTLAKVVILRETVKGENGLSVKGSAKNKTASAAVCPTAQTQRCPVCPSSCLKLRQAGQAVSSLYQWLAWNVHLPKSAPLISEHRLLRKI